MPGVVVLDLSRNGMRGVQIDAPFSPRPRVSRFAAVPVPEGTIFDGEIVDQRRGAAAVKALWKAGRFTTRKAAFGISNRKVVVREVTMPALADARRKAALRYAVEGQVPIDLDDAILDFLPLRSIDGGREPMQEGLLVATARSSLESTVRAIERTGRQVEAIDFAGFSLLRALAGSTSGTPAIVNIGAASTTVVISDQGRPAFARILPNGGDDITHAIERALGVDFDEAEEDKIARGLHGGAATSRDIEAETVLREHVAGLIDSIRNTLAFYGNANPDRPVDGVVLVGGGSRLTGLGPVLARALGLPTAHGDPMPAFQLSRRVRDAGFGAWGLELAATLGVAMGAKR